MKKTFNTLSDIFGILTLIFIALTLILLMTEFKLTHLLISIGLVILFAILGIIVEIKKHKLINKEDIKKEENKRWNSREFNDL